MIKLGIKMLKLLNSAASPWQLAGGLTLGMFLGLTPGFPLQDWLVVVLILLLNVHVAAAIFGALLFGVVGLALTPLTHLLGVRLLEHTALTPLWTAWYYSPLPNVTRFNNSVMLGGMAVSLIAAVPLLFCLRAIIVIYRRSWRQKVMKWKIIQVLNVGNWLNITDKFGG